MRLPFSGIIVRYRSPKRQEGQPPVRDQAVATDEKSAAPNVTVESTPEVKLAPSSPMLCEKCQEAVLTAATSDNLPLNTIARDDELHINIWEIGDKSSGPFMDIGVMISNRESTGFIQVDLPWEVDKRDLSDLGAKLNGEKSVAAIFNEVVHYDGFAEGNFANISFRKDGKDEKPFSLLRLNSELFSIEYVHLSNGTTSTRLMVEIPRPHPKTADSDRRVSAYVRFRIRNIPKEMYTNTFEQKDRTLISSRTVTRIIDFRINVRRGVPEELLSGSETVEFPHFGRIHCFLTTDRSEDCSSQGKTYIGYRSLMDEDVWNEYVRLDHRERIADESSVRNFLGHQWTASDAKGVKDLIVLGRFSKTKSGIGLIIRFIILGIIFGATGNGVWEAIPDCVLCLNKEKCLDSGIKVLILAGVGVAVILAEPIWKALKRLTLKTLKKDNRASKF